MVDDGVPFSHGLMWGGGDAARYEDRPIPCACSSTRGNRPGDWPEGFWRGASSALRLSRLATKIAASRSCSNPFFVWPVQFSKSNRPLSIW
jgi:hypothetical protein